MRLRDNDQGLLYDRVTGFGFDRKAGTTRAPKERAEPPAPVRRGPPIPWENPFLALHAAALDTTGDSRLPFDEATWEPADGDVVGIDVESFINVFVVCAMRFRDGARAAFEISDRSAKRGGVSLRSILDSSTVVTFNGLTYDLPMIAAALRGATPAQLKEMSDRIIKTSMRRWDVESQYGTIKKIDHIDLLECNPSIRQSLKTLHGRLHGHMLVDLPFHPDRVLSKREINLLTLYCFNDLEATQGLWSALAEPQALREALGKEHNADFRSKSDAQVGEAIVLRAVEKRTGRRATRPVYDETPFRYRPPPFVSFDDPTLVALLDIISEANLRTVGDKIVGFGGANVEIAGRRYHVGIGGLHSTEACQATVADEDYAVEDVDVASEYPNIIMKLGLYPPALGPVFLDVYKEMINERLAAKAQGMKVKADGLKIACNGTWGKTGNLYSSLYAPPITIGVTLTGQLCLLMLIERCEAAGVRVVSANTDGALLRYRRVDKPAVDAIIAEWERATGFQAERTPYAAVYSRDVNCYIALKADGNVKRKGPVADPWEENDLRGQLMKNPQMPVLSRACVALARDRTPLEETIRACTDMRAFVTVIKVTGGAVWRGHELGRVIRFYWSTDGDPIMYVNGSKRVSRTEGARPMIELTKDVPLDLDVERYIYEARELAIDLAMMEDMP